MKLTKKDINNCKIKLINFFEYKSSMKNYGISSMKVKGIIYDNEKYLLKTTNKKTQNQYKKFKKLVYSNSVYSEYIACHIGKEIGLNIQETILGYMPKEIQKNKILEYDDFLPAIVCKDFCHKNESLLSINFLLEELKNEKQYVYEDKRIKDILKFIYDQNYIDNIIFKKHFWDMFIFDAFIGNFNRHGENWGLIYNEKNNIYRIAPIYDCGSSMHPKASSTDIKEYAIKIKNETYLNFQTFSKPFSFFRDDDGNKINYYNFLIEKEFNHDKDIAEAILRIAPKIVEINENGIFQG